MFPGSQGESLPDNHRGVYRLLGRPNARASSFNAKEQEKIKDEANEVHDLLFTPELNHPIKSVDLPVGGPVYSGTALAMVYDLIALSVGVPSRDDDTNGVRTVEYLSRCKRVVQLLVSNDPSSLGLHPAVYFYSWTGKHQPILLLTMAELIVELERTNKLPWFTRLRGEFETFLFSNRSLLNQLIRKYGANPSGTKHLRQFYDDILFLIESGVKADELAERIIANESYEYLQPKETPYSGTTPTKYSTQVKSGLVIRELLPKATRCAICMGYIPFQAISIDHKIRVQDGGLATVDNAQLTHPYCNSGYKESLAAKSKKASGKA
jgi:hypothetical protein